MRRNMPAAGPVLIDRIREHLGTDVASLPVITETFDPYEHLNVQVALDDYFAEADPAATRVGMAGEQKHYVASALSSIMGQGEMRGMRATAEGPVDYVNFRIAEGRVVTPAELTAAAKGGRVAPVGFRLIPHTALGGGAPSPIRFGVPITWLLGGCITLSNVCVNIAAAKKATNAPSHLTASSPSPLMWRRSNSLVFTGFSMGYPFAIDAWSARLAGPRR